MFIYCFPDTVSYNGCELDDLGEIKMSVKEKKAKMKFWKSYDEFMKDYAKFISRRRQDNTRDYRTE